MQLAPSAVKLAERSLQFAQREMEICRFTVLASSINQDVVKAGGDSLRGVGPSGPEAEAEETLALAHARYENACLKLGWELRH